MNVFSHLYPQVKAKTILFTIAIPLVSLIIAFDLLSYYPEKHQVRSFDYKLFKIESRDSITGCYELSESILPSDTDKVLIVGFRLSLDYVSVKHEHFWDNTHAPYGWFGNNDSISAFTVLSGGQDITNELTDASAYKNFNCGKTPVYNHSAIAGIKETCYTAESFKSAGDFINAYNRGAIHYSVRNAKNYHFFIIPKGVNSLVIRNGIQLNLTNFSGNKISRIPDDHLQD